MGGPLGHTGDRVSGHRIASGGMRVARHRVAPLRPLRQAQGKQAQGTERSRSAVPSRVLLRCADCGRGRPRSRTPRRVFPRRKICPQKNSGRRGSAAPGVSMTPKRRGPSVSAARHGENTGWPAVTSWPFSLRVSWPSWPSWLPFSPCPSPPSRFFKIPTCHAHKTKCCMICTPARREVASKS